MSGRHGYFLQVSHSFVSFAARVLRAYPGRSWWGCSSALDSCIMYGFICVYNVPRQDGRCRACDVEWAPEFRWGRTIHRGPAASTAQITRPIHFFRSPTETWRSTCRSTCKLIDFIFYHGLLYIFRGLYISSYCNISDLCPLIVETVPICNIFV